MPEESAVVASGVPTTVTAAPASAAPVRLTCACVVWIPGPKPLLEIAAFLHRTETELLLKSRYVVPARLCRGGFPFQFPEWQFAARDLCHDGAKEW